jgi:hypothetical protein
VTRTPETFASSIVAVGSFNPAIFTPDWLEKHQLIGSLDAEWARDKSTNSKLVISHEVSQLETKLFSLQVVGNQLTLTSKDALSPALRDLASGIFQLVPHTPITAIGLNFLGHYRLNDEKQYHAVGDHLAPKAFWSALYPDRTAGIADLAMRLYPGSREKPESVVDYRQITIQPSNKIKFGIFLAYNDHHTLRNGDHGEEAPGTLAAQIVDEQWELVWKDAIRVFECILSSAIKVT